MAEIIHLTIERGPDQGRRIHVPDGGVRIGRSSKNDVCLLDPLLSRHHCRIFFKPNDGMWLADLGSSNETLLNGKPVQECRVKAGDTIGIGDTVIRISHDGTSAAAASTRPVDLGLGAPRNAMPPARKVRVTLLVTVGALVTALALAAWLPKFLKSSRPTPNRPTQAVPEPPRSLEIWYEKVQADTNNIFRYQLEITADNKISISIDDVSNNRHIRKDKPVDEDLVRDLMRSIEKSPFFSLDPEYTGIQPGVLERYDLGITIGRQTRRTRVLNRVEPDGFKAVRESIEEFGKNELGLWAIQFSADKLTQMAQESYQLGLKLYDERKVKYSNLASGIKAFKEAEWYLETVEPKPPFYADALAKTTDCKNELQQEFEQQNFRAARAMKLNQWDEAAAALRIILELVPDRSDKRYKDARRNLLDVERRLENKR